MFYENELCFLREVYKKNHLSTDVFPLEELSDYLCRRDTDTVFGISENTKPLFSTNKTTSHRTVYRVEDGFERHCLYILLPDTEYSKVLFIGPYLIEPMSKQKLLQMGEAYGIPPQKQKYLIEYYASIPVLDADNVLWSMFYTFCERIWKSSAFSFRDITHPANTLERPVTTVMQQHSAANTLVDMKALERRYAFENELIHAVTMGQIQMESRLNSAFAVNFLENRVKDPVRNAKNYGIIMNTLLRKAAENGGVHPLYLDRVSSNFAVRIENVISLKDIEALMAEMFRVYCRLVNKHSVRKYSLIVQKTLITINADLSANLSPRVLAESQGVSLGYLSTIFKKRDWRNDNRIHPFKANGIC